MRKTIDVNFVRDTANNLLKSDKLTNEQKKGLRLLVEDILHKTGNYQGFMYHAGYEAIQAMTVQESLDENSVRYF